jgi:putative ABC transport system substrate-binding protein
MTRATATTTRTVLVIWLTSIATVLLLFAAPVADAQSPATVPRIGYVWSGPPGSDPEEVRGFRQGLREVGYVEGRNLLIEYRYAGGDIDRVPQLIAGLLDLKVAILITPGTPVTAIAKREAGALPIVTVVNDPVGAGFAKSLARPGGTITGLSLAQDETFAGKLLELVKETLPKTERVGMIWNPANRSNVAAKEEIARLATKLRVQLSSYTPQRAADIDAAFTSMSGTRTTAVIIVNDPFFSAQRAQIAQLAASHRIAAFAGLGHFVESGALMSYGPSLFDLFRRSANWIDKILKGAKPADLAIEQPTLFELVINAKTAKALGLTMPRSLLLRADRIIDR